MLVEEHEWKCSVSLGCHMNRLQLQLIFCVEIRPKLVEKLDNINFALIAGKVDWNKPVMANGHLIDPLLDLPFDNSLGCFLVSA